MFGQNKEPKGKKGERRRQAFLYRLFKDRSLKWSSSLKTTKVTLKQRLFFTVSVVSKFVFINDSNNLAETSKPIDPSPRRLDFRGSAVSAAAELGDISFDYHLC